MAIGARKAFEELPSESEQERWLKLPSPACDGLPKTGEAWVRSGLLAATVFVPPTQAWRSICSSKPCKTANPRRARPHCSRLYPRPGPVETALDCRPQASSHQREPFRKTIFDACLRITLTYNAAETFVLFPLLRLPRRRMKKLNRRTPPSVAGVFGCHEWLAAAARSRG